MTIINDTTVAISTYDELKEVISGTNNYNYIYLAANITLTGGIAISSSKQQLTIDGTYNGTTYEYIDQKRAGTTDTIYLSSANTKTVTVKNIKITGYNYYGVIYVPESTSYQNTIIEYNNITYLGPQISYNPSGTTRFISSNITIQENYSSGNEVAECNKIEIGGTTTIIHKSTGNSAFWFRNSNPALTILKDAKVIFESLSRELFYGPTNLEFTIEENANFQVTTYNGLAYGTNGTGTTTIKENATFNLKKTNYSGSYATWYSYGSISITTDATLIIINNYPGITTSNYNISFQGSNQNFIINNPKKILLYNTTANIINNSNTTNFQFTYNRINLFNKSISLTENITTQNLPTYSWYKTSLSEVTGTITNSKTTITTNNYTEAELSSLPALTNFELHNKQVLSMGTILLCISPLTDKDTQLTGITEANSSVLIEYDNITSTVIADENGNFSYSYSDTLPIGTQIKLTAKSPSDLIYTTKVIEIVYSGELSLDSAPKYISFIPTAFQTNPVLCPKSTALNIIVTDSRVYSSNWKLYATISNDLTSSDGKVLEKALVFLDDTGEIIPLSTTPMLVYTGENNNGTTKITTVSWQVKEGIILQVLVPLEINVEYKANIIWNLEE